MTLDEVFGQYTQEPFALRPWEIARLTDWQLEHLYRRPAERAAREAKGLPTRHAPAGGAPEGGDGPDYGVVTSIPREREAFVRWWRVVNGGGREAALKKFAEAFPDGQ